MENDTIFNLKELVGEKALEAYDTYIKLSEYSSLFFDTQKDIIVSNDYTLRNYSYPMGLYVKRYE